MAYNEEERFEPDIDLEDMETGLETAVETVLDSRNMFRDYRKTGEAEYEITGNSGYICNLTIEEDGKALVSDAMHKNDFRALTNYIKEELGEE